MDFRKRISIFRFMIRMEGFLIPEAFKKQSIKYLQDFKDFVAQGTSVSELD